MGGAYGTPCSGELQFWTVMQAQMRELVKQTTRIANALERQADPPATWWVTPEPAPERPATVDCAALRKTVSGIIDVINGWHADGSLEYRQYSQLSDLLEPVLAAIPEGGAK